MLQFQRGDESAFDKLVGRNTGKVHALVYRFLGDPGMLEDLTQEVFLRVYRTVERYEPAAKFSTWLYRITANLCFNVLRKRRRMHPLSLDVAESDDGDGYHRDVPDARSAAPGDGLDEREMRRKVSDAVASLPDNQRVAIILNKYEGKSYEEIAEVLNCTTMAVKSLLSRARNNLRNALVRYIRT